MQEQEKRQKQLALQPGRYIKVLTYSACAARGKFSINNNCNILPACARAASSKRSQQGSLQTLTCSSPRWKLDSFSHPCPAQQQLYFHLQPTSGVCFPGVSVPAFHCPVSAFLGRHWCVQESQSTLLPEQQNLSTQIVYQSTRLITDSSLPTLAATCLKHLSINFHYSRGQVPQKRNPFCLIFLNSKMFKPETWPWQTGCRKGHRCQEQGIGLLFQVIFLNAEKLPQVLR